MTNSRRTETLFCLLVSNGEWFLAMLPLDIGSVIRISSWGLRLLLTSDDSFISVRSLQ